MHTCKLCFGECLETSLDTPVTSGSVLAAEEPFYLNSVFFEKKNAPTDTGDTSAFKLPKTHTG